MNKHITRIHLKAVVIMALFSVLLCTVVFLYDRQTNLGIENEIALKDIMTQDHIHLVCMPRRESESYTYALKKWQERNYNVSYQAFIEIKDEKEKHYSKGDYEVAVIDHALGCLCLDIGKYEEAYEFLNSAHVSMLNLYGESNTATLAVLSSIVYYDYVTGKIEQCLKDARTVIDAVPPLSIWAVTSRIQMLVDYECGENSMAIRGEFFIIDGYMKEQDQNFTWNNMLSLQEYLTRSGRKELDSFGYRLLALLSWDIGNGYASFAHGADVREDVEKWYAVSQFICNNLLGEEAEKLVAQIIVDHAYFLTEYGEKEAAFTMVERAMDIQRNMLKHGNICPEMIKTYSTYGEMLFFLSGDKENALEYYEKARILSESLYGLNNNRTAQVYFLFGKYYAMLEDYERSLTYLKKCESIKKNTLSLKDRDAINLYLYLAGVYKARGELELVEEYKQRANEVANYLRLNILSADKNDNSTESSVDHETLKENFDWSQYKEGDKWEQAINAYINAVQKADADVLMDALQTSFLALIPAIVATQPSVQVDVNKISNLYKEFYQGELMHEKEELTNRFGNGFSIRFEPYAVEYMPDHDINRLNDYLFVNYNSEIVLMDGVVISGSFFVSGGMNAGEEEVADHMLCQELPILNINGEWKLGIPDEFSKIPRDVLAEAMGISLPKGEGSVENDG